MKDPLNPERTPYEVLGIEPGASPGDVQSAFQRRMGDGAKVEDLQRARAALRDITRMALVDVFEYDAALLTRLGVGDRDLRFGAREHTRQQLESAFNSWINARGRALEEGVAIGHALFVLSYFSGLARPAAASAAPELRQVWQRVVGYFAFLCANAAPIVAKCEEPVWRRIEEQLIQREQAGASAYGELRAMIPIELRAARELHAKKLADGAGIGPLLAEALGFRSALADTISRLERASPGDESLGFLAGVFGGLAPAYALRERRDFRGALSVLERLPDADRKREEVRQLHAELQLELGKTLASDTAAHDHSEILGAWEAARSTAVRPAFRAEIESEIEAYSVRRATELSRFSAEEAVALLRRARRSANTSKVRAGLVNMLRQLAQERQESGRSAEAMRLMEEAREVASASTPAPPGAAAPGRPAGARTPVPPAGDNRRAPPAPGDPTSVARALREGGQPELGAALLEQAGQGSFTASQRRELAACLGAKAERDIDQLLDSIDPEEPLTAENRRRLSRGIQQALGELRRATGLDPSNAHAAETLARLIELARAVESMRPAAPPSTTPARTPPPRTPSPRKAPARTAQQHVLEEPHRSPGHAATLLFAFALACSSLYWLVQSKAPWVESVRRDFPAFAYLAPVVKQHGAHVLAALGLVLLLAPARLGWLSEAASRSTRMLARPFVVRWSHKGPLGRVVEYLLMSAAVSVLALSGLALKRQHDAGGLTALRAPSAPAPAPAPRDELARRVERKLTEISKLAPAAAAEWASEHELRLAGGSTRADEFLVAAALEQSGARGRAKERYRKLGSGADDYARSARLRLLDLDNGKSGTSDVDEPDLEAIAWFKTEEGWRADTVAHEFARRRLSERSEKPSVRLLSAIRARAPVSAERAYLFVFGALVLAFKLVQLPFTWKTSEIVARLRSLEPERQALMRRFADDAQARGLALMEFYRRHNVNFASSCLSGLLELAVVVWALFALTAFAPQWELDGSRFLWLSDITRWDSRVAGLWIATQILVSLSHPRDASDPTARARFVAMLAMPFVLSLVAFYFKLPACVFIFLTLLSLASFVFRSSLLKLHSLRYG